MHKRMSLMTAYGYGFLGGVMACGAILLALRMLA